MKYSRVTAIDGIPAELKDEEHASRPHTPDAAGAAEELTDSFAAIIDQLKSAADRGSASLSRTLQQNPTLALAGLVAVGALAGLVIHNRRTRPQSLARQMQRDMVKHTRSIRQAMRREIRDSGLPARYDQLGSALGSIDWKPYLQPILDKASAMTEEAKSKLAAVSK